MSPTSRHGDPAMFMVSVDQRLLIDRQESERKRKLAVRYWSHTSGMCNRPVAKCDIQRRAGPERLLWGYFEAPTSFASGDTAYHVPPTPWPLVSPGFVSPENV